MLTPITLGLRGLQFIFSVVVLGLAVTLLKGQVYGAAPTTTKYSSFTGGFGILVAGFGAVATLFLDSVTWISGKTLLVMGLDAVSGLLFLAGGIAWAVGLKNTAGCSNLEAMVLNELLNGGMQGDFPGVYRPEDGNDPEPARGRLRSNCQKATADQSIQFVAFAICTVLLGLGFYNWRRVKGGGRAGAYV